MQGGSRVEFREYRRYELITAAYIEEDQEIDLGSGPQMVNAGSYIVVDPNDGSLKVVSRFAFESECVPVGEAPGVTLLGNIGGASIKTHSETGLPILEVKLSFGTADPEKMAGLIKAWHRQRAAVLVSIEPQWRQGHLFGSEQEPAVAAPAQ